MKKLKVALIIDNMGDGGAQQVVLNYLRDCNYDESLDIRLFVCFGKLKEYLKKESIENKYKIYLLDYKINKWISKIEYNILLPIKLFKVLKRFKPDIIHGHMTQITRRLFLAINICKNIFITLHSNPFRIKGNDLFFAKLGFNKLGFIPVCLNEEQAKMAQQHYGFKHYEILHNGVDFEKIRNNLISKSEARKIFNVDEKSFVLSACGRLHEVKNYPLMLEVFKKVLEKRTNAILLIAGEGHEKELLINYSDKLGIKENVKFLGNLDNPIPLYCTADAFVMTSLSEASPLVLLEAQACGCKCIISAGVPKESIISNKVISMKEDATIDEWSYAILNDKVCYEKPRFKDSDYEVHTMAKRCVELYFKYLRINKSDYVYVV